MAISQIGTASISGLGYGFKNRIINGAMMIDQRNAGASTTPTASGYALDRWRAAITQSSKFSIQQSTTAPTGFVNSTLVTSLSAYSVLSTDIFSIQQRVEGLNVADLAWGTVSASAVTLSFWVRSSVTGVLGGAIQNSAADRCYPFSYTISSANTWEYKTITIPGDTTGTWLTSNGIGLILVLNLGTGSTYTGTAGTWAGTAYYAPTGAQSVVGTNGATFYITGVQLEAGTVATTFDYRPYGTELALCQRYYQVLGTGVTTTGNLVITVGLFAPLRVTPSTITTTLTSGTGASFGVWSTSQGGNTSLVQSGNNSSNSSATVTVSAEL